MLDTLTDTFAAAQQWLFEAAVQPIAFAVGAGNLLEDGFTATGWLLVGLMRRPALAGRELRLVTVKGLGP